MDDHDGIRVWRPYGHGGELDILWRKTLGQPCAGKPLDDPRLFKVGICLDSYKDITLLNVHLPCDDGSNLEDYQIYLANVSTYLGDIYPQHLVIYHLKKT